VGYRFRQEHIGRNELFVVRVLASSFITSLKPREPMHRLMPTMGRSQQAGILWAAWSVYEPADRCTEILRISASKTWFNFNTNYSYSHLIQN